MKKNKGFILFGIIVFAIGICLGYAINSVGISSIQGYMFSGALSGVHATNSNATNSNATNSNAIRSYATRSNATNSNATNSNATNSNATNSNATNSNATNANATRSNATGSNVSYTDGIIYLQSFALKNTTANLGDRLGIELVTTGSRLAGATVVLKSEGGAIVNLKVEYSSNGSYVTIPQFDIATGKYTVVGVLLTGGNSNGTTFTKYYTIDGSNGSSKFNFDSSLTIPERSSDISSGTIILQSVSLESTEAKAGGRVYLNIKVEDLKSNLPTGAKLTFVSGVNKMVVFARDLGSRTYFDIPSTVTDGEYELTEVALSSKWSYRVYGGEANPFEFNTKLSVKGFVAGKHLYNNQDLDSDLISQLYDASGDVEVIADGDAVINHDWFNVVKGKNRNLIINYSDNQLIFNGRDISEAKSIDVSIRTNYIPEESEIGKLIDKEGVLLTFGDNGYLPGKALVRIKAINDVSDILENEPAYVYLYNDDDSNFSRVARKIKKTSDGYYEFSITHNSDYIMIVEELDDSLVVDDPDDGIITFQKSSKVYVLLIVIALVVVGGAIIVLLLTNKKKKLATEKTREFKKEDLEDKKDKKKK